IKFFGGVFAEQIAAATKQKHATELEVLRAQYTTELERLRATVGETHTRLNARVDTAVYRSKAQFDIEFKVLQTIWQTVSEFRRLFTDVRPAFSKNRPEESPEDAIVRRANVMLKSLNKLQVAAHDNEPFYPQEIFDSIQRLIALGKTEQIEIE